MTAGCIGFLGIAGVKSYEILTINKPIENILTRVENLDIGFETLRS